VIYGHRVLSASARSRRPTGQTSILSAVTSGREPRCTRQHPGKRTRDLGPHVREPVEAMGQVAAGAKLA